MVRFLVPVEIDNEVVLVALVPGAFRALAALAAAASLASSASPCAVCAADALSAADDALDAAALASSLTSDAVWLASVWNVGSAARKASAFVLKSDGESLRLGGVGNADIVISSPQSG